MVSHFLDTGAKVGGIPLVRSSLPALAAGVKGYLDFCRLVDKPPIHLPSVYYPMECVIIGRSHIRHVCATR